MHVGAFVLRIALAVVVAGVAACCGGGGFAGSNPDCWTAHE